MLPCEGLIVGQVRIDYAYGLEFTETPERAAEVAWRLRVNTPFTFSDTAGSEDYFDPGGPAEHLAPALVARHQQLVEGNVWANGHIRMTFANNAILEVEPHNQYEAWTMTPDPIDGFPFTLVCPIGPQPASRLELATGLTATRPAAFRPARLRLAPQTPPPQLHRVAHLSTSASGPLFSRRKWSTFQPALTSPGPASQPAGTANLHLAGVFGSAGEGPICLPCRRSRVRVPSSALKYLQIGSFRSVIQLAGSSAWVAERRGFAARHRVGKAAANGVLRVHSATAQHGRPEFPGYLSESCLNGRRRRVSSAR